MGSEASSVAEDLGSVVVRNMVAVVFDTATVRTCAPVVAGGPGVWTLVAGVGDSVGMVAVVGAPELVVDTSSCTGVVPAEDKAVVAVNVELNAPVLCRVSVRVGVSAVDGAAVLGHVCVFVASVAGAVVLVHVDVLVGVASVVGAVVLVAVDSTDIVTDEKEVVVAPAVVATGSAAADVLGGSVLGVLASVLVVILDGSGVEVITIVGAGAIVDVVGVGAGVGVGAVGVDVAVGTGVGVGGIGVGIVIGVPLGKGSAVVVESLCVATDQLCVVLLRDVGPMVGFARPLAVVNSPLHVAWSEYRDQRLSLTLANSTGKALNMRQLRVDSLNEALSMFSRRPCLLESDF